MRFTEDRPKDCRYCYFWSGKKKGCELGGEKTAITESAHKRGFQVNATIVLTDRSQSVWGCV